VTINISISGSLGVGKTTLVNQLSHLVEGSVVASEDVSRYHFLPLFYRERERYAMHSRLEFLEDKAAQLLSIQSGTRLALHDRSVSELIAFANVLREQGMFPEPEYQLYFRLYSTLLQTLPKINLVIWLRASTDVALDRVQQRGREFEKNITAQYLDSIEEQYKLWFSSLDPRLTLQLDTTHLNSGETAELVAKWVGKMTPA
jgi:deoxyadenosine/deoxycytidine kinase